MKSSRRLDHPTAHHRVVETKRQVLEKWNATRQIDRARAHAKGCDDVINSLSQSARVKRALRSRLIVKDRDFFDLKKKIHAKIKANQSWNHFLGFPVNSIEDWTTICRDFLSFFKTLLFSLKSFRNLQVLMTSCRKFKANVEVPSFSKEWGLVFNSIHWFYLFV